MMKIIIPALALMFAACGNIATGQKTAEKGYEKQQHRQNEGVVLSERDAFLYEKTLANVIAAEEALEAVTLGEEENVSKVLANIRLLNYRYNAAAMNDDTRRHCEELSNRIANLKERAKSLSTSSHQQNGNTRLIADEKAVLVEQSVEYPCYLEAGDVLYYDIKTENIARVKIYNVDRQSTLKNHVSTSVNDSLEIKYSAIYLVSIETVDREYVSNRIKVKYGDGTPVLRPNVVSERVACRKEDFGAVGIETVKLNDILDGARKLTLRGQLKSAFSGTSRALVAIKVPQGASDIMYSARISTSELQRNEDGQFYKNVGHTYNRIDIFKLPVYERRRRSGIIDMLLDENRPVCEEDAYCNMYVIRNQNEAKKFQDSKVSASKIDYDVDCSTLGTQSCNGTIPVNDSQTIYLAFENERMRYANYLWVEAVAVMPTTEYYRTKYSVEWQ